MKFYFSYFLRFIRVFFWRMIAHSAASYNVGGVVPIHVPIPKNIKRMYVPIFMNVSLKNKHLIFHFFLLISKVTVCYRLFMNALGKPPLCFCASVRFDYYLYHLTGLSIVFMNVILFFLESYVCILL